jgi:hypothetical protein
MPGAYTLEKLSGSPSESFLFQPDLKKLVDLNFYFGLIMIIPLIELILQQQK